MKRLVQIAMVIAAIPAISRSVAWTNTPRFVMPPKLERRAEQEPKFVMELLPRGSAPFVHSPSVVALPNGDLLAAWYAGSGEMQPDVGIVTSRQHGGVWSEPVLIESAAATSAAIHVRSKSVGNPVLFNAGNELLLFYTSVVLGGWSGGTICMKRSADGVHWSPARRIHASPLFNLSALVKGEPIAYDDGTIALPVYQQLIRRWPSLLRVTRDGDVVDAVRIERSRPLIQPWIVPLSESKAVALMRWSSLMPGNINIATTADAGRSWSEPVRTPIMHRDSAVAGARLSDGSLLVAYNNMTWDRRELALVRSTDGMQWSKPWAIEHDHEPPTWYLREYSYPWMMRTGDGMIHLFYSWRRMRIAHVAFNESWIMSRDELARMRK